MAEFKPIKAALSEVDSIPIIEGQFIATTDAPYIFVDISNTARKRYNEISIITEAERQGMIAPIEGFYFTSDVTNLWYCKDGKWNNITNASHPFDKTNPHKVSKDQIGLNKVQNLSASETLDLITQELIIAKLGYTPPRQDTTYGIATGSIAGIVKSGGDITVNANGTMSVFSVDWSRIKNVPDIFAPSEHTHTKAQITDFPTSLPASDVSPWAKAARKPSYTPSEVGVISVAPISGQVAVFDGTTGKIKSTGYTIAKSVPSNAVFTDTVYKHPAYTAKTSGLYKITVDATGHVSGVANITKADITALGIPAQDTNTIYGLATATTNGLIKIGYTASGKNYPVALDSNGKAYVTVPWTDTNTVYTHPATSGNKHIPAGGSSGQILRWSADGTAVWGADNNTIYELATSSTDGLLSSGDFTKLSKFTAIQAGYLSGVTSSIQNQLNNKLENFTINVDSTHPVNLNTLYIGGNTYYGEIVYSTGYPNSVNTSNHFILTLSNDTGSSVTYIQTFYEVETCKIYLRSFQVDNGVWTDWKELGTKSTVFKTTVPSSSWYGYANTAPFNARVSVRGVTASNGIEVTLGDATEEEALACAEAQILMITQEEGNIMLHAYGEKPTVDIPIIVIIRGDL